jgi:hypothetical protein
MDTPIIVKYNKKTQGASCECGGEVWFEGTADYKIPVGFGDLGAVDSKRAGQFGVSRINLKGYYGTCGKCRKTVLAYTSKRLSHKRIKVTA